MLNTQPMLLSLSSNNPSECPLSKNLSYVERSKNLSYVERSKNLSDVERLVHYSRPSDQYKAR